MLDTPVAHTLAACGLSNDEAAELFGVSVHSVVSWRMGRRGVPGAVWTALATLHGQIQFNAEILYQRMIEQGTDLATTDPNVIGHPLPEGSTQMALVLANMARLRST